MVRNINTFDWSITLYVDWFKVARGKGQELTVSENQTRPANTKRES